jgi:hypothetical protein
LADANCGTTCRKLFKVGALLTISVRRIKLARAVRLCLRKLFHCIAPSRLRNARGAHIYPHAA